MATAVLQLELKAPRSDLLVDERYAHALVLLRWSGRPVGQVRVPVANGRIGREVLEEALARAATAHEYISLYPMTWELLVGAGLVTGGATAAKLLHYAVLYRVRSAVTRAGGSDGSVP